MTPDERVFRTHLEAGPFQSGVDRELVSPEPVVETVASLALSAATIGPCKKLWADSGPPNTVGKSQNQTGPASTLSGSRARLWLKK